MKYRCIKGFTVDSYDADGFLIENSSQVIEECEFIRLMKQDSR